MYGRGSRGIKFGFMCLVWRFANRTQKNQAHDMNPNPTPPCTTISTAAYVLVFVEKDRNESRDNLMPFVPVPQVDSMSFVVLATQGTVQLAFKPHNHPLHGKLLRISLLRVLPASNSSLRRTRLLVRRCPGTVY